MEHENKLKGNNQLLQFLECNGMSFVLKAEFEPKQNQLIKWFRIFNSSTGPAYTLVNPIQHVQLV